MQSLNNNRSYGVNIIQSLKCLDYQLYPNVSHIHPNTSGCMWEFDTLRTVSEDRKRRLNSLEPTWSDSCKGVRLKQNDAVSALTDTASFLIN